VHRADGSGSGDPHSDEADTPSRDGAREIVWDTLGPETRPKVVDIVSDYCVSLMAIHGNFDSAAKRAAVQQLLDDKTVTIDGEVFHVHDPAVVQRWLDEDPRAAVVTDMALELKSELSEDEANVLVPRVLELLPKCSSK
jgi:hypothetical protein